MSSLTINKDDLHFLNSGTGSIDIDVHTLPLDKPLDPSTAALFTASFEASGTPDFKFGASNDLKLSISGGVAASLKPFFKADPTLSGHGLDTFFDRNPHKFILALDIAANAAADATATFSYSALSATAELKAGADGEFWFSRAYDNSQALGAVLTDLVTNLRPPSSVAGPLNPGEVIYLEYGGYLNFGLSVSAGYQMQGSHSLDIANLLLSESYSLSLLGKLGMTAGIAGSFSIQLRQGDTDPSWIRVSVQKKHSSELGFAADVKVGFTSQSTGLPGSAGEFLGALVGVNAKNWVNFAQRIVSSTSPADLQNALDSLAGSFVTEWVGKGIDALSDTDFAKLLANANTIVTDAQNLDTTAINLFDKYFSEGEPALVNALTQLRHLSSLDQLAKLYTNSNLVKYIEELTGGDPLSWILGKANVKDPAGDSLTQPILDIFNGRVEDALALLQSDAHSLIKEYITLAKSKFSLDTFLGKLSGVTTIDGLKQKADAELNGFVQRIMGRALNSIDPNELHKVLAALQDLSNLEDKLFNALQTTLNQTASLALHAEYTRASEHDALLEIEVNPATASDILHQVSRGDFTGVLQAPITTNYRVMGGTLLDQLTRTSKVTFNIAGWHTNFNYSSLESVVLAQEQQIVPGDQGTLTVFTTVDLKTAEDVQKNSQQLHANFMLRLIGETQGSIDTPPAFDKRSQKYLMDTVTSMSASYQLTLANQKATKERLADFLGFAKQFDLTGVTLDAVLPFMETEKSGGNVDFGDVTADYQVQFVDQAIVRMFSVTTPDDTIRHVMRQITLGSLLNDEGLADIGWAYSTQAVYNAWRNEGAQFTNTAVPLQFSVGPSLFPSIPSPGTVVLNPAQISVLANFFRNEDALVAAVSGLQTLVHSTAKLSPSAFASKMKAFADSFSLIDKGMRTNAMFSVFDQLIAQTQPPADSRGSSLKLLSTIKPNPTRTKVFVEVPSQP